MGRLQDVAAGVEDHLGRTVARWRVEPARRAKVSGGICSRDRTRTPRLIPGRAAASGWRAAGRRCGRGKAAGQLDHEARVDPVVAGRDAVAAAAAHRGPAHRVVVAGAAGDQIDDGRGRFARIRRAEPGRLDHRAGAKALAAAGARIGDRRAARPELVDIPGATFPSLMPCSLVVRQANRSRRLRKGPQSWCAAARASRRRRISRWARGGLGRRSAKAKPGPARARNSPPSAAPSATASPMSPHDRPRTSPLPSGFSSNPSIVRRSPSRSASPAIGVRHEPSRAASMARSALTQEAAPGSCSGAQQLPQPILAGAAFDRQRALADRRQHDLGRQDLAREPGLAEPCEAAQRQHDRVEFARRQLIEPGVDIAADRHDRQIGAQPQQLGLTPQEAVPILAPVGKSARLAAVADSSASRGSSRARTQPISRPSGSQVSMSFNECTARSIVPRSSASSISLVKRPLPPISASNRSCTRSPVVRIVTISTAPAAPRPGWAAISRSRTSAVWRSAIGLPRVPRRSGRDGAGLCRRSSPVGSVAVCGLKASAAACR